MAFVYGVILGATVAVVGWIGFFYPYRTAQRLEQGRLLGRSVRLDSVEPTSFNVETTRITFGALAVVGTLSLLYSATLPPV